LKNHQEHKERIWISARRGIVVFGPQDKMGMGRTLSERRIVHLIFLLWFIAGIIFALIKRYIF
jgi:hypothetical protein